jgi:hypothetical protein
MTLNARLRPTLLAAAAALLIVPPARAADATADQAAKLETRIRAWLATLAGPNVPLAARPIHVAPQGDHYQLSIDVAGQYPQGVTIAGDPITANVSPLDADRPLDANRWSVLALTVPSPLRVDVGSGNPGAARSMSTKIAEQNQTGIVDLSFATTSTLDSKIRGYTTTTTAAGVTQTTHLDGYIGHTALEPAPDGRVNFIGSGKADHLSTTGIGKDGQPYAGTADSMDINLRADKVSLDRLGAVIRAITAMSPAPPAPASAAPPGGNGSVQATGPAKAPVDDTIPPEMRKPLHDLVVAARDLMGGFQEDYAMHGVKARFGDTPVTLASFASSLGFGAPDGKLDLHMSIALDGLESTALPPGPIHDFLPRIAGVPADEVAQFLLGVIDSGGQQTDAIEAQAIGLLMKGPLSVSIDELTVDAGPSTLKAVGAVSIGSPADITGQAQIRMTGFDALIQQSGTIPQMKDAVPILFFLKGIGKADGAAEVWDIVYGGGSLTVNGTDMSALVPGDKKPAPQPATPPPNK